MARPHRLAPADVDAAYTAAQMVVETHRRLVDWLRVGRSLAQVDEFVGLTLRDLGCRSCFLGYKVPRTPAFPSHACLSVNHCVVHGTATYYPRPLERGDLLKVDIGVWHRGWIGDAAWTYALGDYPSDQARQLMACGKSALARGVTRLRPGRPYLDWAREVQGCVEGLDGVPGCGFHLIRGLGGHGYGRRLHEPPFISNVVPKYPAEWPEGLQFCEAGTLVAVEPMVAVGTGKIAQKPREWPIFTADGSLAVHYEHDVLITEHGPRVLTEGLDQLPDVVG
ncbi:MAG TPA: M24 family metallopeptidase [Phycisphaerales bacterium]|nr:M24 family metallopeptidase [Phycisphaerales bacterium]